VFNFYVGHITTLLMQFLLENKQILPAGWAARVLVQCGVRFSEIWDLFNEMYESHVRTAHHVCQSCFPHPAVLGSSIQ